MKVQDFEEYFDSQFPDTFSFDWDNSGLLVSANKETEVTKIITCLDVTFSVIEKAIEVGAQLIVSHHPLIFDPIKKINQDNVVSRKIILLLENNISLISLHTRFDFAPRGLNSYLCDIIGISIYDEIHPDTEEFTKIIGSLSQNYSPEELAERISSVLDTRVTLYSADLNIKKVAICSGAGKDYFGFAKNNGVDAFITGDVSHHVVVDALEEGISVIDFGHYGSEKIFCEILKENIDNNFGFIEVIPFTEDYSGKVFGIC